MVEESSSSLIFSTSAQQPHESMPLCRRSSPRRKAGTPAAEIKVAPQAVTPAFLQRAVQINATVAEAVVAALREGGFLDEVRSLAGGREWALSGGAGKWDAAGAAGQQGVGLGDCSGAVCALQESIRFHCRFCLAEAGSCIAHTHVVSTPNHHQQEGQLHKDPRSTLTQLQPLLKPVVGGLNLEPDVSPLAEVRLRSRQCWRASAGVLGGREVGAACAEAECCLSPLHPSSPLHIALPFSIVVQLLNVAYARHEIVSDTTDVTLEWLEAGGAKPGLPGVLQAR